MPKTWDQASGVSPQVSDRKSVERAVMYVTWPCFGGLRRCRLRCIGHLIRFRNPSSIVVLPINCGAPRRRFARFWLKGVAVSLTRIGSSGAMSEWPSGQRMRRGSGAVMRRQLCGRSRLCRSSANQSLDRRIVRNRPHVTGLTQTSFFSDS